MKSFKIHLFILMLLLSFDALAQKSSVLFRIDGKSVFANEFKNECQNFVSQTDTNGLWTLLNEYANYRLEAYDAKIKRLDTAKQYKQAMDYYNNYLVVDHIASSKDAKKYIDESIKRGHYQYRLSCIKVNINANSKSDTSVAYKKAMSVRSRILNGQSFARAARQVSDDNEANFTGGYLGWVAPIDFNVGYEAENYIINHYNDTILSQPIRSGNYYYLIKVQGRREAVDMVTVSAILKYKKKSWQVNDSIKNIFVNIQNDLKNGKKFSDLQKKYTDYPYTEQELPLNQAYNIFTTKIADIEAVGKCSNIIETDDYFCIVKLEKQSKAIFDANYEQGIKYKFFLTDKFVACYDNFVDSIKQVSNYVKYMDCKPLYKLFPDSAIFEARWTPGYYGHLSDKMFSFDNKEYTYSDFIDYVYQTQVPTPYNTIKSYLDDKFNEYLHGIIISCINKHLANDVVYQSKLKTFSNLELFKLAEKHQNFEKAVRDSSKVYNYYSQNLPVMKTSHVLKISFYDYLTPENRKKAIKFANNLAENGNASSKASDYTLLKSGTFNIGDYDLADDIIKSFDSGKYNSSDKIVLLDAKNVVAIVEIVEKPREMDISQIYPVAAPAYFRYQKDNYVKLLKQKYNFELSSDAQEILQTIF